MLKDGAQPSLPAEAAFVSAPCVPCTTKVSHHHHRALLALLRASSKLEMGLSQALGLGHLQTRRRPESGSVLRGFHAVVIISSSPGGEELLLLLGSASAPLTDAWCQLSVVTLLASLGAGMMSLVPSSASLSSLAQRGPKP